MSKEEKVEKILKAVAKQGLKGTNKELINQRVIIQAKEKILELFENEEV